MPFSTKFPLTEIMESMQYWYDKTGSRINFEYCVWKGINDGDEDIKALIKYSFFVFSFNNYIKKQNNNYQNE